MPPTDDEVAQDFGAALQVGFDLPGLGVGEGQRGTHRKLDRHADEVLVLGRHKFPAQVARQPQGKNKDHRAHRNHQ
jgi:hypothetical protein